MIKNKFFLLLFTFFFQLTFYSNLSSEVLSVGDKNAKITVKVFSSLTCPHCATFHNKIFRDLKKDYIDNGKVKFEHHAFPLDFAALNAEKIVRCASKPKSNFELLTKIYDEQKKWAVGSDINKINNILIKIGKNFGLKEVDLRKCLVDEASQESILNERIQAQKEYDITSTPTIYINDKKYEDKHEFKSFKKQIDKLL